MLQPRMVPPNQKQMVVRIHTNIRTRSRSHRLLQLPTQRSKQRPIPPHIHHPRNHQTQQQIHTMAPTKRKTPQNHSRTRHQNSMEHPNQRNTKQTHLHPPSQTNHHPIPHPTTINPTTHQLRKTQPTPTTNTHNTPPQQPQPHNTYKKRRGAKTLQKYISRKSTQMAFSILYLRSGPPYLVSLPILPSPAKGRPS